MGYEGEHRALHFYKDFGNSSYVFKYLFSQSIRYTAYEIDKENTRYVTLGANPPRPQHDFLVESLAGLNIDSLTKTATPLRWDDCKDMIVIDDSDLMFKRLRNAFGGDCPPMDVRKN